MQITDVMERPQSRDLLAAWYAVALEDQATSGLSVAEYADEIGVSAATLYQWRRRLACADQPTSVTAPTPELIEVVVTPDRDHEIQPARSTSLTIHLDGARSIEVTRDFEPEVLARIVRTLESC